ncbi:helix-hairpin-helix domain-containing protein [Arthrobacter sp. OVS8]|nr:helix-hairpin-helix domain-containing protein [Arthrobacter sp. OVS8]
MELPRGSRLHQAIEAAGGSAPDADSNQLNLAAVLEDGQKVLVPRKGETLPSGDAPAGGTGGTGGGDGQAGADGSSTSAGKVNLNTAGVEQLATLPRVGPVLAQRIVDWRAEHGNFRRVEELDAVDGVGPKMLAALLPLVRV